ncbi:hypothetical protein FPRO03_03218 [Fusarium proliferatum]|nr:hypothetical protein FPRO03_03218 [Fusarium proliferatum]
MESRHWDLCWRCLKHLDDEPKWRASSNHKLFCDDCAKHTGGPPFRVGHALCSRCAYGSRQRRLNLKRGFIDKCPLCRKKPRNPVRVVACTIIKVPEDEAAVPVDVPAQPSLVDEPAQPVLVLGVRLGKSLNDRQVRVRWEDTWERYDLMGADKRMQVKGIVGETPESIKIRWKDTWELLKDLEDGPLKEEAKRLLEDKYSV